MSSYISPIPQEELAPLCEQIKKNIDVPASYFDRFEVKRGLRNRDGSGVMAGLTKICSVEGYYMEDGERQPIEGRLHYRGMNVNDLVDG